MKKLQYLFFLRFLFVPLFALLGACANYTQETQEMRSEFRAGAYQKALETLEKSSLKEESKNRLLYRLEKAMILDRLGEREKSRSIFLEADKLGDELYTVSISRTAATFFVNESSQDYAGEDYELVAIHTIMALSFLQDGKLDDARIEARKINSKLNEINGRYDSNKNRYAEDAFARYLAGMIYEARGETDSAIIDYTKAIELYQGDYSKFVDGGVPSQLVKALYRVLAQRSRNDRISQLTKAFPKIVAAAQSELAGTADWGEVAVIHETGHIAIKTAEEFFLPIGKQLIRFSFPVIRKTSFSIGGENSIDAGQSHSARSENAQNMDSIARFTLEDRRLRLIAKQSVRLLAKGQLTEQAYKNFGILGGLAANAVSAVTESADTRSWTLLPEGFSISRVRVPPGPVVLRIKTNGRLGDVKNLNIGKRQLVLVRAVE